MHSALSKGAPEHRERMKLEDGEEEEEEKEEEEEEEEKEKKRKACHPETQDRIFASAVDIWHLTASDEHAAERDS